MQKVKVNIKKINQITKQVLSLRTGLIYLLLTLLVAVALTGGATNAWFTSGDHTDNIFTAGTLDIDATGPFDFDGNVYILSEDIIFNPCANLSFLITNQGTKTTYVRAKFEGHWLRGFHENTASASVNYNDNSISAEDSSHFNYPGEIQSEPLYSVQRPADAVGFTDQLLLGPIQFDPLESFIGISDDPYILSGSPSIGYFNNDQTGETANLITAPGEKFSFAASSLADLADGLLNDLFGPDCLSPKGFKIDLGNAAFEVGIPRDFNSGDFSIKITKNADNTFNFVSNNPKYHIYHMFVKGGAQGSNLYTYYVDNNKVISDGVLNYVSTASVETKYPNTKSNPFLPGIDWISSQYNKDSKRVYINSDNLSTNGVNAGFGLDAATGTGWSHITVYYCEVPIQPDPNLELIKLVKVQENGSWYTSQEYENSKIIDAIIDLGYTVSFYDYSTKSTWPLATGEIPKFIVAVANTGNISLTQIAVSDNFFSGFNPTIGVLEPGQLWISEVIEYTGYLDPLPTDAISVKIDSISQDDWVPYPDAQALGDYFYYNKIVTANSSIEIPMHIKICLEESSVNKKYNGAVFKLYAIFEAVQTTNGLVDVNWPDNPY